MIKFEDLKPNESLELLSEEQLREIRGGYKDTLPVDLNYGDDPGPFWGSNPLEYEGDDPGSFWGSNPLEYEGDDSGSFWSKPWWYNK